MGALHYKRHTMLNNLVSILDFYTFKMNTGQKLLAYINRVRQLAARFKSVDVNIDGKEMAMAVLNGLPSRLESLIVALDAIGNE